MQSLVARKALVFIATFLVVLVAGAALALMAGPRDDPGADSGDAVVEESTTTVVQEEEPPATEVVNEEPREEPKEEPGEEPKEEPKEEPEEEPTGPEIVILFPENGAHFTKRELAFEGEVTPGSKVFAAGYEADVTEDGRWRIVLFLGEGGNLATFTAVRDGREAQAQVKVYLDSQEKEEPKDYEFTAHQKYGSCSEPVPYDIFYGTGTPGTKVWIGAEAGSANFVVGESGKWEKKIEFPNAPCNEQIRVVLETNHEYRKVFEFKRICQSEQPPGEGGDVAEPK